MPRFEFARAAGSATVLNAPKVRADVAQLVEHHLAKVRVAGSNPVVRSEGLVRLCGAALCGGVAEWLRQGPAKPCTRVRFPSPPPHSLVRGCWLLPERSALMLENVRIRRELSKVCGQVLSGC